MVSAHVCHSYEDEHADSHTSATPVYRSGPPKSKQANVPDRPPPQGYVCYRCGEKGRLLNTPSLPNLC